MSDGFLVVQGGEPDDRLQRRLVGRYRGDEVVGRYRAEKPRPSTVPTSRLHPELHRRVVVAGAGEGVVTDMGSLLLFTVTDPDGAELAVVWLEPGVPVDTTLVREE